MHFKITTPLKSSSSYDIDGTGRCRWSTNTGEPLVFIKYDRSQLNILDIEKKALALKSPVQLESSQGHYNPFILLFIHEPLNNYLLLLPRESR